MQAEAEYVPVEPASLSLRYNLIMKVDVTPGDLGANKGFWRVQLRDRYGKFVPMGGIVDFDVQIPGLSGTYMGSGKYLGNSEPGVARIEVLDNSRIPKGVYLVKHDQISSQPKGIATLPSKNAPSKNAPKRPGKKTSGVETPAAPELKQSVTGSEALKTRLKSVAKDLKEKGRFPIPRQGAMNEAGGNTDIANGARLDYQKVFDADPGLKEKYGSFDNMWDYVWKNGTDLTTQSPNDLRDIPEDMKELNRSYAKNVLGLEPDGTITVYRNAINGKDTESESAVGYVSLDSQMAYDYGSTRENIGANGRYEIDVKPDEVYGMLGYSRVEDEYGLTIGRGVTEQEGRVRRVGDLEPAKLAPWLEDYNNKFRRERGESPLRSYGLAGQYDLNEVEDFGSDLKDFLGKHDLQSSDISAKYDELYGEGAYAKYKESGNTVSFQDIKKTFIKLDNGNLGLNVEYLDSFQTLKKNEDYTNDQFDNRMKMLSVFQELTGDYFMTHKTRENDRLDAPSAPDAPAKDVFSNPLRKKPLEGEVRLPLTGEAPSDNGFGVRRGLFGDSGTIADEDKDYLKDFLTNEESKKTITGLITEMESGPSTEITRSDIGWGTIDSKEAFLLEYGVTAEELDAFSSLSLDDPEVDSVKFNNVKTFITTDFKKYQADRLNPEKDEIRSLKTDYYSSDNGTVIKMRHMQFRDQDSKDWGESFNLDANSKNIESYMDTYTKMNEEFPIGKSIVIELTNNRITSTFDASEKNVGKNEGVFDKPATGLAVSATSTIHLNLDDDALTRSSDDITSTFLSRSTEIQNEVGFTPDDLAAMGGVFDYRTFVLSHEYGHMYDYAFIGTWGHTAHSHDAARPHDHSADSIAITEIFQDSNNLPSKYSKVSEAEFFAESFAQRWMKGKSSGDTADKIAEIIDRYKGQAPADGESPAFDVKSRISPMRSLDLGTPKDTSYQLGHTAPTRADDPSADAANLDEIFPKDIYDKNVRMYQYGGGDIASARESFAAIDSINKDPDAMVQIFRAVPDGVTSINPRDWVTMSPTYAQQHLDSNLNGNGKIVSSSVRAGDLFTDANSIHEWGWDPEKVTEVPVPIDVSPVEIAALGWYTDGGYYAASMHLREGEALDEEEKTYLDALLQTINRTVTTENKKVYRGRAIISEERLAALEALKVGDPITDRGVMSTSTNLDRANFYAKMSLGGKVKGRVMFEIDIPKGSTALEIPSIYSSYGTSEEEILLPPNVRLEVTDISLDDNGRKTIRLKVAAKAG